MQGLSASSSRPILPVPVLRIIAILVVAASVVTGAIAMRKDVRIAFRDAGPSEFPASVNLQVEAITRGMPPGAGLLLLSQSHDDGAWYARLFQRALYPRNVVVVRYVPLTGPERDLLRRQWSLGYGLAMGVPPPDVGFLAHEDLGTLPALPDRVWFGKIGP
jgi:hypothetical protein